MGRKYAVASLFKDSLNNRCGLYFYFLQIISINFNFNFNVYVCDVRRARYGVELEKVYVNRTADFLWMIMISMTAFLVHLTICWPDYFYRIPISIVCFFAVHMNSSF